MSHWRLDFSTVVTTVLFTTAYFFLSRGRWQKGAVTYFSGVVILLLLESSPLHYLGMHYLFSMHMTVHVGLLLIVAPVLVAGIPLDDQAVDSGFIRRFSIFISHYPWLSWIAGIGVMWFWHIPRIFDAAFPDMQSPFSIVPLLHTFSLLLAGVLFYWPLIGPCPQQRITPPLGVVYLFTACICCSFLGLLITFSPLGVYHHYEMTGTMGFGGIVRRQWEISMQDDQQAAGLIMWVPCCFIYLSACIYLLSRWFAEKESVPPVNRANEVQLKETI